MSNNKHITLKNLILGNKVFLFLGLITLVLNKAAILYIPSRGKYLIDDVIKQNDINLLKHIMFTILISLIIQVITSFFLTNILAIKAQEKIAEIRTLFFNKITLLPLSYFKNSGSGEITSRILNDFDSIRVLLGTGLVELIGSILSILITFCLMTFLNAKLTLYILIPILVFGTVMFFIYRGHKRSFKQRKVIRGHVSANLTEAFRGIKIIKGFVSNDFSTEIIKKDFYKLYHSIKKTLFSTSLISNSGIVFIGIVSLVVMWQGSLMAINHQLTIGELTTFTLYLGFIISPVIQISNASSQFTDANASIERINEIWKLENEIANSNGAKIETSGHIVFKDVVFGYDSSTIINKVSFEIKPKSINAIVGRSGSGKTTITDLIASFYQPKSGTILVDNLALSSININHYRRQLGFVFQETYLFNGSVKENILLANPNATEKEVKEALDNANVTEFLSDLPDGINSIIGENGSKLSEGQKQRIAIARAFLVNPKILILDEATSNLDAHNEQLITDSINRLMQNRTIIIIAHRLNTITNADQILFIDKGQIVETGTHDELMNKQGKYYNLYNTFN